MVYVDIDFFVLKDWKFDIVILYYGEMDCVSLVEGVISVMKMNNDDSIFNVKLVFDILIGVFVNGVVF